MRWTRRRFNGGGLALGMLGAMNAVPGVVSTADRDPELGKVLGPGPPGRCDDYAVGGGVVRWSEDHGKWLMWYYCRDTGFAKDVAPTLGTGRIALAMSDDGTRWERFDGPGARGSIMEPSADPRDFDSAHIGVLDVTRIDDKWYLWYLGGDQARIETPGGNGPRGYRMRTGLAVSGDGITFERMRGSAPGGAALDFLGYTFTTWPNGIHDGRRFLLYYTTVIASQMQFGTEVATSADGVAWEVQGPISWDAAPTAHEEKGIMTRHVMPNPDREGPRWLMLYTALDGSPQMKRSIMAAVSDDGLGWRRLFDEPVFEAAPPGRWDSGGVAIPQLVHSGNEARLYYFGFPAPDDAAGPAYDLQKGIGLAISRDGDLRGFRRVSL